MRRQRRSAPRARTIDVRKLTREALRIGALMYPPVDVERPKTWGDCAVILAAGACPFVGCKHHLYLDINPETGSIKLNFPDLEPWELNHSCSLFVAEAGALTLDVLAARMNVTHERARQLESMALEELRAKVRAIETETEVAA